MRATRVIIISDLHLGGTAPHMMSRPQLLADFIDRLPGALNRDESLELVIDGDFVDFPAIPPFQSWTVDPVIARQKLEDTMRAASPFAPIFDALARFVRGNHRLTILIGNHDLEMALPSVQEAFFQRIGASPHQVFFIADGRAHRIGKALIEHGNRYDDANRNDWAGLRGIVSALSRGETPNDTLRISAGSEIVERIVSPLKAKYPFVDLLQPQGELVALLLCAFEPQLKWNLPKIARLLRARTLADRNKKGSAPSQMRYVAGSPFDEPDNELVAAFGQEYELLRKVDRSVAASDWLGITFPRDGDGLWAIFERGDRVPASRLNRIKVALRRLCLSDNTDRDDGPTQQYGAAANRIREKSGGEIEVVVMGHTHLPRRVGPADKAAYINTGTWADVIGVPSEALAEGGDEALERFLLELKDDVRRPSAPTYADLRIEAVGAVSRARLVRAIV